MTMLKLILIIIAGLIYSVIVGIFRLLLGVNYLD